MYKNLKLITPLKIVLKLIQKYNQYALEESIAWLTEMRYVCCNGKLYYISKKDQLILMYGEENV